MTSTPSATVDHDDLADTDAAAGHWKGLLRRLCGPVWLWPMLATLAITLYHNSVPVMWQDELATISVITRPTGQILATLKHVDAVHGLYYLSMHAWTNVVGYSPFALRFPSAVGMTAAAAFTALVGRRLFGYRAGVAAGLVFAVLPTVARYGQEARSYALIVMSAALALLLLYRALERPGALRWTAYGACLVLGGYFNLVSLAFLCGHALAVLLEYRKTRARALLIGFPAAVAAAVVVLIPLIKLGTAQSTRQIGWIPKPTVGNLDTIWPQIFGSVLLTFVLLAFALLAWRQPRRQAVLVTATMVLLPWLVIWTISHGHTSYYLSKYLFFVLPPAAVLAGAGLASLRLRYAMPLMVGLLVVVAPTQRAMHATMSHGNYVYPDPPVFTPLDYRSAADVVAAGYRPGDAMVYGQGYHIYFESSVGVPYYLPKDVQPPTLFIDKTAQERNDLWFTFCADPAACLGDHPRIWLVDLGDVSMANPFQTVIPGQAAVLKEHYTAVQRTRVNGMTVFLLERTG